MKISFIGFGLIGGSIAKAIRKYHSDYYIEAFNPSKEGLHLGLEDGTLDREIDEIPNFDKDTDIIFLCSPIDFNIQNLEIISKNVSKKTIITDVGSVKGSIHEAATRLGISSQFVGGHPMTGSEKTSFMNADARILENAYYILTQSEDADESLLKTMQELVASIKAIPIISDCEKHDFATAAISHVPHLIAASLVKMVKDNDYDDGFMKMIAAGGFKDITRIASSSPRMWESICKNNPINVNKLLSVYISELQKIENSINNNNFADINELFVISSEYRNSINDNSKGPIAKTFKLYLNIDDEAGAIARIATLLAVKNINIKNIGITHNREHEEGVLYIIFYDQSSLEEAKEVLIKDGRSVL